MCIPFWLESLKGRKHSEEMDVYEKIIITQHSIQKKIYNSLKCMPLRND
jgi:hypothetical protein